MTTNKQIDKALKNLDAAMAAVKALAKAPDKLKALVEEIDDSPQEPPLYEVCYQMLKEIGYPVNSQRLSKLLRKKGKNVPYVNVYQALEYRRKNKGDVSREDGLWSLKGGH